jgi:hypothetical protein
VAVAVKSSIQIINLTVIVVENNVGTAVLPKVGAASFWVLAFRKRDTRLQM